MDPPYAGEVDPELLVRVAQQTLRVENVAGPLDLGIWITNEAELHTLNRMFRGVDRTTDVLSFGEEGPDEPFIHVPDEPRHLGDVAISFPHVVRQAVEFRHSPTYELAFLLVHGVLHLLGYDHEDDADGQIMRAREDAVLEALELARVGDDAGSEA